MTQAKYAPSHSPPLVSRDGQGSNQNAGRHCATGRRAGLHALHRAKLIGIQHLGQLHPRNPVA